MHRVENSASLDYNHHRLLLSSEEHVNPNKADILVQQSYYITVLSALSHI